MHSLLVNYETNLVSLITLCLVLQMCKDFISKTSRMQLNEALVLKIVSNQNRALYFEMVGSTIIYKLKCSI